MATLDLLGWGYGIRYKYGIIKPRRPWPFALGPHAAFTLLHCRHMLRRTALALPACDRDIHCALRRMSP